jgi:hemerythrin-like metal-binding protein
MTPESLPSWHADMSFGQSDIDHHHQQMLTLLVTFYALSQQGQVGDALHDAYHELMGYVFQHFELEEACLARHGYPALAAHQAEHAKILLALSEMAMELMGPHAHGGDLAQRIVNLAIEHTNGPDHDAAHFLQQRPPVH